MRKTIIPKIVGTVLKEIRGDRTQQEFAVFVGVSRVQYNLYETGKRIPPDDVIERLASTTPDFPERVARLFIKYVSRLMLPAERHERLLQASTREALDDSFVTFLVVLAIQEADISLSDAGYKMVPEIFRNEALPQIKATIADLIRRVTTTMPTLLEELPRGVVGLQRHFYRRLSVASATYEKWVCAVRDACNSGEVQEEDRAHLLKLTRSFHAAYCEAVTAFEVNLITPSAENEDNLAQAMDALEKTVWRFYTSIFALSIPGLPELPET